MGQTPLNLPALEDICKRCDGVGHIADEDWIAYALRQNREFPGTLADRGQMTRLTFEEWQAANPPPPGPEEPICGDCEGSGKVLTAEGLVLADFARRMANTRSLHDRLSELEERATSAHWRDRR